MVIEMQPEHGHAAWTWPCSMDLDKQHGHRQATWTWTCSIDMDMLLGHGHASWTWTCFLDMDMQHGHRHVAWIWTWDELLDCLVSAQSGFRMKKKRKNVGTGLVSEQAEVVQHFLGPVRTETMNVAKLMLA
jgi:hypothetical protein